MRIIFCSKTCCQTASNILALFKTYLIFLLFSMDRTTIIFKEVQTHKSTIEKQLNVRIWCHYVNVVIRPPTCNNFLQVDQFYKNKLPMKVCDTLYIFDHVKYYKPNYN